MPACVGFAARRSGLHFRPYVESEHVDVQAHREIYHRKKEPLSAQQLVNCVQNPRTDRGSRDSQWCGVLELRKPRPEGTVVVREDARVRL